ncbi:MAG TPA: ATP-binding protein [Solirubrobacteraceae bacterium]|nr:ATP-binding protein [Solirubrobacteraceae bacterium]
MRPLSPLSPGTEWSRSPLVGLLVAALAVGATTLLVYPLADVAPVVSLGVVYLVAVLLVASVWGGWLGLLTAVGSALAFNWFHIPPTGRFTIREGENWVALAVFLIAALVASQLSQRARARAIEADERRQEADISAEMARLLLRGGRLEETLPAVSHRLAQALALPSAAIRLDAVEGDDRRVAFPLREHARQIGTVVIPSDVPESVLGRVQLRIVPQLEALLAAALERDELLGDVVETEALRRSDVLKTALLRAVSHDLRSPLTAILASVDALRSSGISDDERHELVSDVEGEARRLSRLIDNLLDLSRLEARAAEPRRTWCSVAEVLEAAVHDLGLPEGTFALSVDPELPHIRADAAQLERAFANLLENSSRYAGGHPVSVRARAVGPRIIVRVVDRGPGVPPAQVERIFEPFYRAGTDRTGHRGSGLGLAIARGFIDVNGGRVWVESLPGQGTSFVVELPLERQPARDAAPALASPRP